jgi:acyl-CoA thioester hydrolase
MEIRVYYEDTDCGGVVYYANYLRWLERSRTEFLRDRRVELAALAQQGVLFSVSECHIKYNKPAKYGDLLEVTTEIDGVGGAAFWVNNQVWRNDELLAEARVRIACTSGETGRARRMPTEVIEALNR